MEIDVNTIRDLGFPIALIVWYLVFERPKQTKREEDHNARYDMLVSKLIDSQKECATKLESAIDELSSLIRKTTK